MTILTTVNMIKFKSMLDLHRHAGVAETCPSQAVERRNVLRHFIEQTFNRHETILAGDVVHEVMQKFPFRARVTRRLDGLHEFLDATLAVGEGAALLHMRAAGQNIMRESRRGARQNVADNERFQFSQQICADAVSRTAFPENNELLFFPGLS